MLANFLFSFVTSLREMLEAALLVGIVYGYLTKINRKDLHKQVNLGLIAAVISSIIVAIIILAVFRQFDQYQTLIEGIAMFIAAGILSWMIMWMGKQSQSLESKIHSKIEETLSEGAKWGLLSLVFISVFRELAELILLINAYLLSHINEAGLMPAVMTSVAGVVTGLILAVLLAVLLFRSTINLDLKIFFDVTSLILLIFAAGLVAHGIHEFHEYFISSGSSIANLAIFQEAWNINNTFIGDILHSLFFWCYDASSLKFESSIIGKILSGLVGWNDNPAIIEAAAYFLYYIFIFIAYSLVKKHYGKG